MSFFEKLFRKFKKDTTSQEHEGHVKPTSTPDANPKPVEKEEHIPEKRECINCGAMILFATYEKHNGLCAQCVRGPAIAEQRRLKKSSDSKVFSQAKIESDPSIMKKEGCHMNNGQHDETRVWLVGDYSEKAQEKEEWRRMGFRPSFVKLTDNDLSSLSKSQRQSTAREFAHDGADFFQRGYLHYGLQLWREAVRIDPEIDVVDCGYDKDIIVAMFKIFKDEQKFSNISQPVAQAASDILYRWISGFSSAHLYMTSSKYANNARCAYCGAPNSLKTWPSKGDEVPFYYCKLEESQRRSGGYLIDVRCHKCSKVWCVVWDDDPIWG